MNEKTTLDREISLIICTRDRAFALSACLDAVAAIDLDPARWELLVVNNASTDQTDDVLHAFARTVPFRVTVVQAQQPGLSRARNCGVRASRAPLIAFTDDDCYVAADFLRQVVSAFERSSYGFIGGRVLLHDPSDAPETIKEDDSPEEIAPYDFVAPGFIHGANMAFRREVWEDIGGFDPALGSGTRFVADDVDFLARAALAGWSGAFLPAPTVRHHHGRKPGADVAKLRTTYARGRGAYYTKGCLNPRVRGLYARHWYWSLRVMMKQGRIPEIVREIGAGGEFLLRNVASRAIGGAPGREGRHGVYMARQSY
jgi:glycosyltransferase involved in cell wall biosynthesis